MEERSTEGSKDPANAFKTDLAIISGGFALSFVQACVIPEWYWIGWLMLGFGIPEAIALFNKAEGDTLSEHVRKWFATDIVGQKDLSVWAKVRRVLLVIGMAWLFIHWLTNGTFV